MGRLPYRILRTLLPRPLRKYLGSRLQLKRRFLDPFFFRFAAHPHATFLLQETSPTLGIPTERLEHNPFIRPEIAASIRRWYNAPQTQMVARVEGDIFIEPRTGWPMGPGNILFSSLYPAGKNPHLPTPAYCAARRKAPLVTLDKIISLRDLNEHGYFHFYTDLMTRLELIRRAGCDLSRYTIVLAKPIAQRPYADFMLKHSPAFQGLGGVFLQDKEFITCNEALFAHSYPMPSHSGVFSTIIGQAKAAHPPVIDGSERKLFLIRAPNRLRALANSEELFEILRPLGFEIIDADRLTLPEQITLFANCRHLVGLHGAGLVNTLYRSPHRMSLFEIHEPAQSSLHFNPSYHNLATLLGYDYGATYGETHAGPLRRFTLSAERFEKDFSAFWAAHGS